MDAASVACDPSVKRQKRIDALESLFNGDDDASVIPPLLRLCEDETTPWELDQVCVRRCKEILQGSIPLEQKWRVVIAMLVLLGSKTCVPVVREDAKHALTSSKLDLSSNIVQKLKKSSCCERALCGVIELGDAEIIDSVVDDIESLIQMTDAPRCLGEFANGFLDGVQLCNVIEAMRNSKSPSVWGLLPSFVEKSDKKVVSNPKFVHHLFDVACCAESFFPSEWDKWMHMEADISDKETAICIDRALYAFQSLLILQDERDVDVLEEIVVVSFAWCKPGLERCPPIRILDQDPIKKLARSALASDKVSEFISGPNLGLLRGYRVKLREEKWKKESAIICSGFIGLISCCCRSLIAGDEALGEVFPMILPLIDTYSPAARIPGLKALLHVVELTTDTEFRWFSGLLLSKISGVCSSSNEENCLEISLPLYTAALRKSEPFVGKMENRVAAMSRMLSIAYVSSKASLSSLYVDHMICPIASDLGELMIQFLGPSLEVLNSIVGSRAALSREIGMKFLVVLMEGCKSRIDHHQRNFLALIARNYYSSQLDDEPITSLSQKCASLLAHHSSSSTLNENLTKLDRFLPNFRKDVFKGEEVI